MPLPAPYAPPWKRLGEDGVALLAWLGLKVRELWRRNREGGLPVPGVWPRRWSRLFWPLVVAALLLGVGVVGRVWLREAPADGTDAAPIGTDTPLGTGGTLVAEPLLGTEPPLASGAPFEAHPPLAVAPGGIPQRPVPEEADLATGGAAAGFSGPATPETDGATTTRSDEGTPARFADSSLAQASESPEEREVNRLRAAWSTEDPDPLIAAIRPEPATATLSLALEDAFLGLRPVERQRLAERWWQRAVEAGYSHLRLRDGRGRLLARDALVGGGMVVLEPPGEPAP
jgi:hypothetical protein